MSTTKNVTGHAESKQLNVPLGVVHLQCCISLLAHMKIPRRFEKIHLGKNRHLTLLGTTTLEGYNSYCS